jgi:hypothetical protein
MEEKGSSKDKLIENIRINLISEEQILPKSTEEKILCCCLNYDLTYSEYKSFDTLKKKVIHAYNNKNEEHEKILQDLFNRTKEILNKDNNSSEITQISTKESENEKNSNKEEEKIWRKIGFQTSEPRNDFRAGGIYSLELMIYFIKSYEQNYIEILNEEFFTFALTCIRVSYLVRTYLYLLTSEEIRINLKFKKGILATRKQLKNFCYFLFDNDNLLSDICCITIQSIFQKFKEKKVVGQKEVNYLIIEPIIQSSIQCLQNALNNVNLNEDFISHLKQSFRENFLNTLVN